MTPRKQKLPESTAVTIESLSHDGRGVTHVDGKTVFVDHALPDERVRIRYLRTHSKHDEAEAAEVLQASPRRVAPFCGHFFTCGGCSLQHMDPEAQIRHKQAVLLEQLRHIGRLEPANLLEPLTGPVQGYRHKARLGARYVIRKGRVLIGFREKHSSFIADLEHCGILHPRVGGLLPELKLLVGSLSIHDRIPQIEVAVGDMDVALTIRHLQDFSTDDLDRLRRFEQEHRLRFFLQSGGPESVQPLSPADGGAELYYRHEAEDITLRFRPLDFTQVNFAMNRAILARVLELLQPDGRDVLLDLFCGLGNFTLPLARHVRQVTGVEGDPSLVDQARSNAELNGIDNADFHCADLARADLQASFLRRRYDKVLLDPPRSGAGAILAALDLEPVTAIVYVSCNPATLARDAGYLVQERGFYLEYAGVMDMFPHTAHVEAIGVFRRS